MKPSLYTDYQRNQLARYQILMQRRQQIERIFWSRIQILHLIQAGVLGGSFYLKNTCFATFAPPLLFVGIVLTIILFVICMHDWMDARINDVQMHNIGGTLSIRRTAERWSIFGCKIQTHKLLYVVVILFILVDLVVLFCFHFCWGMAVTIALIILVLFALVAKRLGFLKKESWPPCN